MSSPEEVPADIGALFKKFRDKDINPKEQTKLLQWIMGVMDDPGFKLRSLTMTGFAFTKRDHDRLQRALNRLQKTLEVSASTKLKELEADAFAKFIEETWEEAKNIATDTVVRWRDKAIEYGFFDKEAGKVKMKEFIEVSCNFFVEKRDMIETVEERVRDLEATASMFAEISKPQVLRIIALRLYMDFVNKVTHLAAIGIPVPESVIIDVKNEVNRVMLSTFRTSKEAPTWPRT